MTLKLLPVPTVNARETRVLWMPYLVEISTRGQTSLDEMERMVLSGEAQVHLAWDMEANAARALAGTVIEPLPRGGLVCHLVWCTGDRMAEWVDLVDDIAKWAKDHIGCVAMKATARPGWSKFLRPKGYRISHVVLERGL
jgi:hypothetical protein